ncbi:MAG: hypothetical protein HFE75_14890 [Firmicutes bacterium]|nr:hypothetical protein [Bacillota bacterium]NBI63112.1 hypothetical protein [Clostridiales bacterium]
MLRLNQRKYDIAGISLYAAFFLALTFFCYLFPYTGDDWAWGSSIGMKRLESWFENYNGRYAGNLAVMVLTRFRVLKSIFEAGCLVGILCLIVPRGKNQMSLTLVGALLFVCVPKLLLRQAIVWTAGFSNYVISILLVLIYVRYCYPLVEDGQRKAPRAWAAVPLAVLAFVTALFVEHITTYILVMAVAVILYTLVKERRIYAAHVGYLVGAIAGAVAMFSNGAYRMIADHQDGYRTMAAETGIVDRIFTNYFSVIGKELFVNNFVLNFFLLFAVILVFVKQKHLYQSRARRALGVISITMIGLAVNYSAVVDALKIFAHWDRLPDVCHGAVTAIFCAGIIIFCLWGIAEKALRTKAIFLIGSAACVTAPLMVVTPIGSRCFFATYVFFTFFVLECMDQMETKLWHCLLIGAAILLAMANWARIYVPIYQADIERLDKVRQCVRQGEAAVEVTHYPHENYLWCSVPKTGSIWEERYKLFYDIPLEVKIKIN